MSDEPSDHPEDSAGNAVGYFSVTVTNLTE